MSFVAILTSLKLLFRGPVTCKNFILTGPKFWAVICHQYGISALDIPQMSFGSETSNGIENNLRASSLGCFTMGREKEGEPATMFLEFEYLHRVDAKC